MFSCTFFCFRLSAILDIPSSEIIISGLFKHRDYKDLIKRKRKPWGKKRTLHLKNVRNRKQWEGRKGSSLATRTRNPEYLTVLLASFHLHYSKIWSVVDLVLHY